MMKRITEAWFELNGIRSDEMGILLRTLPTRTVPTRKYKHKDVSGRDGTVRSRSGGYTNSAVELECDVIDESRLPEIIGWLSTPGTLRFSDEAGLMYTNATLEKDFARKFIIPRATAQRFTVKWTCDPFRIMTPDADPISITQSGTAINNDGTVEALPRIKITGDGDFALTIGMQTMFFSGIEGGIIVDAELGDALTIDGTQLINAKTDGALFRIKPGNNVVSWLTGGEDSDGSVTEVEITPRWRFI